MVSTSTNKKHYIQEINIEDIHSLDANIISFIVNANKTRLNPTPYSDLYFLEAWTRSFQSQSSTRYLFLIRNTKTNDICAIFPLLLEEKGNMLLYRPWGVMFGYPQPIISSTICDSHLQNLLSYLKAKHKRIVIDFGPSKIDWYSEIEFEKLYTQIPKFHAVLQIKRDAPFIDLNKGRIPASQNLSQNIRTAQNRIKKDNKTFEFHFNVLDSAQRSNLLKTYESLHLNRWPKSNFNQSEYSEFHKRLFLHENSTVISSLVIDSSISAIALGTIKLNTFFLFGICFNPSFTKYSPGILLLNELTSSLKSKSINTFDFMNDLEGYKTKWTSLVNVRYQYIFFSSFYDFIKFKWTLLKQKFYVKILEFHFYLLKKSPFVDTLIKKIIFFRKRR